MYVYSYIYTSLVFWNVCNGSLILCIHLSIRANKHMKWMYYTEQFSLTLKEDVISRCFTT